MAAAEQLDLDSLTEHLAFFAEFVEDAHHAREEEVLFDRLCTQARGLVDGPIAVLMKDHAVARAHARTGRRALAEALAGDAGAEERLVKAVRSYVAVMRPHMVAEEQVLFPVVERLLGAEDLVLLADLAALPSAQAALQKVPRWEQLASAPLKERTLIVRQRAARRGVPPATALDARSLDDGEAEAQPAPTLGSETAAAVLFDDGAHQNLWLHDFGRGLAVQANQFLIVSGGEGMILDPGGPKVYPAVYAETMLHVTPETLRYVFLSHQDPDVGTSLNAWLMDTRADAYISRLWSRFVPHFGIDRLLETRLHPIPDEGRWLALGDRELALLPAHFLHSPGNFHVWDPTSRVLFSGDLGASLGGEERFVADFDAHAPRMRGFHERYMTSQRALTAWVEMVSRLPVETIAPQHGAVFKGRAMVERFLAWCTDLPCGVDLLPPSYAVPPRPARR